MLQDVNVNCVESNLHKDTLATLSRPQGNYTETVPRLRAQSALSLDLRIIHRALENSDEAEIPVAHVSLRSRANYIKSANAMV
jgi:hypothetical protein